MKSQHIIGMIVGGVIIAGLSFYGGIQYQVAQRRQSFGSMNGVGGTTSQFGGMRTGAGTGSGTNGGALRGRPVVGSIISQDDSSLTVKLVDGSTKIVFVDDKTIYNKTAKVDKSEVKTGDKVGIFGTANVDGSVTAQNVQLDPQFRSR